ncbi:protein tramtrack, alpha isoform-like [Prorops nasuta]|uniref:protein tramtrack, alpha isoform-like n=1 Tax=Prorops nasuta TaxID=863751 RepID=UPI0034CE9682
MLRKCSDRRFAMMGTTSPQYRLRWNNHGPNLMSLFDELLLSEAFTDVTLVVENGILVKCHKLVLAACSPYFQCIFNSVPCKHPVVVLHDIKYNDLKIILEYMYRGEISVLHDQLGNLLKVAAQLKVKGLVGEKILHDFCEEEASRPSPTCSRSSSVAPQNTEQLTSPAHSIANAYSHLAGAGLQAEETQADQATIRTLSLLRQSYLQNEQRSTSQSTSDPSYENNCNNTSPLKCKKLSKMLMSRETLILRNVLGQNTQGDTESGDNYESNISVNGNGSAGSDTDRRNSLDLSYSEQGSSSYMDTLVTGEPETKTQPQSQRNATRSSGGKSSSTVQKQNWKRYKQYTREDMMAAIEAVRSGMTTPKASRKYGVPSRTLYEKVNSLGITTSRPLKRAASGATTSNSSSSSACFPYGIGGNINGRIYNNNSRLSESESDNCNTTLEEPSTAKATTETSSSKDLDFIPPEEPRCSPSPVIQSHVKLEIDLPNTEDQVEDLSINRRSDIGVIVPLTSFNEGQSDNNTMETVDPSS